MEGWVKIYRKMADWEWYSDSHVVHLFLHFLINANREQKRWRGIDIFPGQVVTGRESLALHTGISERSIRTALSKLKSTGEVTIKTYNKFSVITVCNWDEYQGKDDETDQQPTSNRPATDQQPTTPKEGKEDKKDKKVSIPPTPKNRFDEFYAAYPKKRDRKEAEKAYSRAIERADEQAIIDAAKGYARECAQDKRPDAERYVAYPATWLNKERWLDLLAPERDDDELTHEELMRKKGYKSGGI